MSAPDLEVWFPLLTETGFEVTSPATARYNCIAWAAGRDNIWMWPDPMGQMYWPNEVPRQETVEAFISAFALYGYTDCNSTEHA